jgi:Fe2+ or Zn2+ uptake regulation protein
MSRPALVRQQILELLETYHLLSATQILEKLETQGQGVNKTTVYRALDGLVADDLLTRMQLENGLQMYEQAHHHHDHIVCTNCGRVDSVDCQLTESLGQIPGYDVQSHQLTVYGICDACRG